MKRLVPIIAFALSVAISACSNQQPETYVYHYIGKVLRDKQEIEKDPVEILAENDSLAYVEAYMKFVSANYSYKTMINANKEYLKIIDKPLAFTLLDDEGNDIREKLDEISILDIEDHINGLNKKYENGYDYTNNTSSKPSNSVTPSNSKYYVSKECYGAISKDALKALVRHLSNNDIASATRQLSIGELVPLDAGTSLDMISYGAANCKVEITSGTYNGRVVYVITEFVGRR